MKKIKFVPEVLKASPFEPTTDRLWCAISRHKDNRSLRLDWSKKTTGALKDLDYPSLAMVNAEDVKKTTKPFKAQRTNNRFGRILRVSLGNKATSFVMDKLEETLQLMNEHQYEEALTLLQTLPSRTEVHFCMAVCFISSRQYDKASKLIGALIDSERVFRTLLFDENRINLIVGIAQPNGKMVIMRPSALSMHYLRSLAYRGQEKFDKEVETLHKISAQYPDPNKKGQFFKLRTVQEILRSNQSNDVKDMQIIDETNDLQNLSHSGAETLRIRAHAEMRLGFHRNALNSYRQVLSRSQWLTPRLEASTRYERAKLYLYLNSNYQAKRDFYKILDKMPDFRDVKALINELEDVTPKSVKSSASKKPDSKPEQPESDKSFSADPIPATPLST